jgi:hypothetical protein
MRRVRSGDMRCVGVSQATYNDCPRIRTTTVQGSGQRLSKDPDNDCPRIRTTTVQGSGQRLSKDPDPEGIDAGTDAVRSSDADAGTDAVHKGV